MRVLLGLALLTLLMVGLGGCLDEEPVDGTVAIGGETYDLAGIPKASSDRLSAPDFDFTTVIESDHGAAGQGAPYGGHAVRSLHEGSHFMELAGWNDLTDKLPPEAHGAAWAAMGLWEDTLCVTQFVGTGGVAIVDVSDPQDPQVLSHVTDALTNGDCQFTEDGKYLFAGAYLGGTDSVDAEGVPFFERGSPGGYGINVWDVSDPENPVHVLFSNTGEYHTHHLFTDDEGTIWLVQAYSGNIYRFHPDDASLELVTTILPMEHDMWIDTHLITGQDLLFSGSTTDGFVIYDFDDPANVSLIADWLPPEDIPRAEGWHRHEMSHVLIDDKVILVVSGETCGTGETRPYIVVDITDVEDPITMGSWELPGTPVAQGAPSGHLCEFSSHEFSLKDGYLATANYHAGTWLIDIGSAERLLEPVTLGYYLPSEEPAMDASFRDSAWPWTPFVWGAQWSHDGYIYSADASSGLYSFKVPGFSDE